MISRKNLLYLCVKIKKIRLPFHTQLMPKWCRDFHRSMALKNKGRLHPLMQPTDTLKVNARFS